MPVDETSHFLCTSHGLPCQFVGTVPSELPARSRGASGENVEAMASLPAGTVTFLFSDIEGSTRLLQRLGDGYGDLVAQHRRVMREAATAAGGTEIDAQGDAFFFSFARARDAAAGALAAQRELGGTDWPADAEVKVRMGLHTGEPTLGDEGYVGLDVVRGARIAAAAHGGQILVSETTRALLPSELPDGARVVELGEHSLKDLDRPERLFQLVAPGLTETFPQPRSDAAAAREDELTRRINAYVDRQLASALGIEQSDRGASARDWLRRMGRRR
jgi:class 3 adenylate cyclase